jgi:death on curing protein
VNHWLWVEQPAILAVHDRLLAEYGGSEGIRDMGGLESALGRPQNLAVYGDNPDIADLAASYAVGIAKAHAFVDGNKRVAWATARAFLRLNGHGLIYDKAEAVAIILRVADSTANGDELAAWFRDRLRLL